MGETSRERVKQFRSRQKEKGNRQITVMLDRESAERFDRLKAKMNRFRKLNNNTLVCEALKVMEKDFDEKFKPLILKQITKRHKEGYSNSGIADYLNDRKIPTFSGSGEWHGSTISKLLSKKAIGSKTK